MPKIIKLQPGEESPKPILQAKDTIEKAYRMIVCEVRNLGSFLQVTFLDISYLDSVVEQIQKMTGWVKKE